MEEPFRDVEEALCDMKEPLHDMEEALCDMKEALCDVEEALCDMKEPLRDMKEALCGMKEPLRDRLQGKPRSINSAAKSPQGNGSYKLLPICNLKPKLLEAHPART